MNSPRKKTHKQRQNGRMSDPASLRFFVRAHLHPQTFQPLIRFKVGDKIDISVPVAMMRQVAIMINDAAVIAELMAGHAAILVENPDITLEEFGPDDKTQTAAQGLRHAIKEASNAFQEMLIEAWNLGAAGRAASPDIRAGDDNGAQDR